MQTVLFWIMLVAAPAAPDTLVICPAVFQSALAPWASYRRAQGHEVLIVDTPPNSASVRATVRRVAQTGRLKYLLLIGDVSEADEAAMKRSRDCIPTNYVMAKINTRWGSEPTIATDVPYADIDGDGVPDLAVGRVAADSTEELSAFVSKVIRYEQAVAGEWQRRLNLVIGPGGFGAVTDALIQTAGRRVIRQTVPKDYEISQISMTARTLPAEGGELRSRVRGQLNEASLAWIYLGHGLPTELDRVPTKSDRESLFSVRDVAAVRCGACSPLAVLIACYTGAIDAPRDCLAEELSLAANGPVAVIAGTRVTMPYGNTVLGYELLRACFRDEMSTIGEILLAAQQRTKRDATDDPLRESLDAMCRGLSPPPVDLSAERAEHVMMYHLFGDPLLRLRRWQTQVAQSAPDEPIVQ